MSTRTKSGALAFTKVPIDLTRDQTLSDRGKVLASWLIHRQGKNKNSWWSQEKIAQELGWSARKVQRASSELEASGWLTISKRASKTSGWLSNTYEIHAPYTTHLSEPSDTFVASIYDTFVALNRTNEKKQTNSEASAEMRARAVSDLETLDKPSDSDLVEIQAQTLTSDLTLDKLKDSKDKSATDEKAAEKSLKASNSRSQVKPSPELLEALSGLPEAIRRRLEPTATRSLNELVSSCLIFGRTTLDLRLDIAERFSKAEEIRNPSGALIAFLRDKAQANSYTPRELTPTPPPFSEADKPKEGVPIPEYVRAMFPSKRSSVPS